MEPVALREPPLLEHREVLEALASGRHREAWSALETVLRAERDSHLRAAAFSSDAEMRLQHRGVVRWLEEWLLGATEARYAMQARERLGLPPDEPSPDAHLYMESDGLDPNSDVRA